MINYIKSKSSLALLCIGRFSAVRYTTSNNKQGLSAATESQLMYSSTELHFNIAVVFIVIAHYQFSIHLELVSIHGTFKKDKHCSNHRMISPVSRALLITNRSQSLAN